MLSQFNDEVLLKGPIAVLPQNLNTRWLKRVQKQCDDFLDRNFSENECRLVEDIKEDLLIACVLQILQYQRQGNAQPSIEEVVEAATVFSVCMTMESVQRESDIGLIPPGLDNIFDTGRIREFKKHHPDFIEILDKACIIRNDNPGWIQSLKNKVFSMLLGT